MPDAKAAVPIRERLLNVRRSFLPVVGAKGDIHYCSDVTGRPQVHVLRPDEKPLEKPVPEVVTPDRTLPVVETPLGLLVRHDSGGDERWQLSLLGHDGSLSALTFDQLAKHENPRLHPGGRTVGLAHNPGGQDDLWLGVLDLETAQIHDWLRAPGYWDWAGWSPDGKLAVVTHLTSPTKLETYLLDQAGALRRLLPEARRVGDVHWTADGRLFALTDLESEFMGVAELDAAAPERPRRWLFHEQHDCDAFKVDPSGRFAIAVINDGIGHELRRLDLHSGGTVETYELGTGVVYHDIASTIAEGVGWSPDGEKAYVAWESATQPAEIYELPGRRRCTITTPEPLPGLISPIQTSYRSFDGLTIPALFYRIDDQPRPTVVYFHGGPESQLTANFMPRFQLLLQEGINVFAPNVRGSTGFGSTYFSMDDRERRWDAVRDGCEAARHLKMQGLATRVGAMGGSYGGFMVLAVLVAEPELWDAAVEYVGIADWHTFLRNTSGWRRAMRIAEYGDPDGNEAEFLAAISPLRSADRIRAPLLVIHGRNDPRVPVSETEEIARATGAELVIFEDEGHSIARQENLRVAYERTTSFLAERLLERRTEVLLSVPPPSTG